MLQRSAVKTHPSWTLTSPYVAHGSQARLSAGVRWTQWSSTVSGSPKGLSEQQGTKTKTVNHTHTNNLSPSQTRTHLTSLFGLIVCHSASYFSSGKNGHGELQQALDLDLHRGQGTLADCQRLSGGTQTFTANITHIGKSSVFIYKSFCITVL